MTGSRTIQQQIRKLIFAIFAAMMVIVAVLTALQVVINGQYTGVLACANTAADHPHTPP